MPSGTKKRRAAKKKKEQSHNSSNNSSSINNTNPQGSDDPRSQDERDSDGGSPKSQDQQHQHDSCNEENEEPVRNDSPPFLSEHKPTEGVTGEAQGSQKDGAEADAVIKIEREMHSEQDIPSKDVNVIVEQVESTKEVLDGDNKSSSSGSSDVESKEEAHNSVEKVFPVELTQVSGIQKSSGEVTGLSVMENLPTVDSVTTVVPVNEVAKHVTEDARVEIPEVLEVVKQGFEEEDKLLPKSNVTISGLVPEENEGDLIPISDEKIGGVSTSVVNSNVNQNGGNSLTSSAITETSRAENIKDSGTSNGNVIANEGKMLTSSRASEAVSNVEKAKNSESSEYAETQSLVPQAHQVAQRTSWTSCCGLFEVFSGSNR